MVSGIQGFGDGLQYGNNKKEPPYASLFQEHGISPNEVREYLQSKGYNSPKEVEQAIKNGENPFAELFAEKGISDQEVANYEQQNGINGQSQGQSGQPGPPPEILAQLQQYGLSPTGSLEGDLQAIAQAKAQQSGNQQGQGGPKGPPPEIMTQLQQYGLQPTGSLQGDLQAIQQAKSQQSNQNQGYNTNFLSLDIINNFLNKQS